MIRLIHPLENTSDFNNLTALLSKCLDNDESFKFLSYSLVTFDKKSIESLTQKHKENGIEYLVYETGGLFTGVLAYKENKVQGFELFLLAIDKAFQKKGIGQNLIDECIKIATQGNYKSMDSFVFADNKKCYGF